VIIIHICPLNLILYKIIKGESYVPFSRLTNIKKNSIHVIVSMRAQYNIYRLICQPCRVLAMLAHGLHDLSTGKVVRLLQLEM